MGKKTPMYILMLERKKLLTVEDVDNLLRPMHLTPDQAMAVKNWLLEVGRMEQGVVSVVTEKDLKELSAMKG